MAVIFYGRIRTALHATWQENRACDKTPRMIEVDGGEKDDDVRVVGETLSLERNA
jgi:hypothetical protein